MLGSCSIDLRRIDAGELRDEREPAVPERERVAGMEAAVLELVDGAQRERAEVVELPDAAEVEDHVALDDALDPPERGAERDAAERDGPPCRAAPAPSSARQRERQRDRAGDEHEHERQRRARRARRT